MRDVSIVGLPLYTLARYGGMGRSATALRRAGLSPALGGAVRDEGDAGIPKLEGDSLEGGMKNFGHFMRASETITAKVGELGEPDMLVCLGGECSLTVGALAGLAETHAGKPGMLWIDTHGDFNTPKTSPSGYIGGMCLAIACGRGPTLGEKVESRRPLLQEDRLVHLGSRALDPPELEMMRASPMGLYTMKKVNLMGATEAARQAAKRLSDAADWLVCHLDVDVLDPAVMPAVNYPTPGGMTVNQAVAVVKAMRNTGKLKVLDIAAYNADFDRDGSSAKTIVKMLKETFA
ncbi:MAG: arginase family protein [Nitrososphaerales archaeon]|nr:arginase family protein [Nitrososphaerales archaeon]